MAELLDRVQTMLGTAYTVERELGGGGMSRVFLAREEALGRRVVVKVLPPETAAGVNLERFRREIQLAASLQHPHIVPLLASGAAGDLLYYTMPLVEGESLRAKLAREGELPIGEGVRILRDVVDALAYAHAHGVVHRDIKPDNVLITGHHAVVTDFGVAKAVSAATDTSSLTSLGVALGTPAYMAPEQAAADPHVDHRADLYAVGVLAYEMLGGRPPFAGMAPQQVLAAHVTQTPAPLAAHRPSVPPALDALVMRCLEKKPADRVQRAEDLLDQLEAMSTPSGGVTPTGATAAFSSGTAAAMRRAHPLRVAALFGVASVVVLAIVYALVMKLGLPDWVFVGAIALLGIGLPIMLFTGRREQQRVVARTTGLTLPPPRGIERLFTWRRSLMGGVLAFSGLGVVAIAYTAMRLLGIGPVGTLVASGVLEQRQPVILADFANHARDSTLGPALTEAFRVDLSQSPTVRLVDARSIAEALQRMQRPLQVPLAPELAREVAVREGIKAIVAGQIDPAGRGYLLSASVVSAANGAVLTAVRETATSDAELIPAVDRLSKALRERIGESLVTIRADEPLERVTTSSLDALRKYTQAVRLFDGGDYEGAASLLQEATTLDTGFAMAWRKLAAGLSNIDASRTRQVAAATQAFTHRDRLPELERELTAAYYYDVADFDPERAMAAYRAALELDPNSNVALNNLALRLIAARRYAEAESLLVRGVRLGQGGTLFLNLIESQVDQGHSATADSTLKRFASTSPNDPTVLQWRSLVESGRRDYTAATRTWTRLREVQSASAFWRERTSEGLAAVDATKGQIARAAREWHDFMEAAEARGLAQDYLTGATRLAWIDLRYRNRPAEAIATVTAALALHPLSALDPSDRPYASLAYFFAEAGRVDDARRLLAEYERTVPIGVRRGDLDRHGAEGAVTLAEGRTQDAITSFQAWNAEGACVTCGLFEIATAYQKAGQPDSALAYYTRYAQAPALFRVFHDEWNLAATYQRLGELYEARGDRARAIESYGRFVDLWKDADPELQPIVRDVRARIGRLSGER